MEGRKWAKGQIDPPEAIPFPCDVAPPGVSSSANSGPFERRRPMVNFAWTAWRSIALAGGIFLLVFSMLAAAEPADKDSAARTERSLGRQEGLERFRKLIPATRLRLIEMLPQAGQHFHKVTRGSVR